MRHNHTLGSSARSFDAIGLRRPPATRGVWCAKTKQKNQVPKSIHGPPKVPLHLCFVLRTGLWAFCPTDSRDLRRLAGVVTEGKGFVVHKENSSCFKGSRAHARTTPCLTERGGRAIARSNRVVDEKVQLSQPNPERVRSTLNDHALGYRASQVSAQRWEPSRHLQHNGVRIAAEIFPRSAFPEASIWGTTTTGLR